MTHDEYWLHNAARYGWVMPSAPWWKRLPLVRHIRYWRLFFAVLEHERFCISLGKIPQGYDRWVLYGIWHGMERKP